jgi:mono/diheme cytochrome c family protein
MSRLENLLNLPKNAGVIGPFIGVSILVVTVAVLVIQMTIRPWATDDYGSETHLNTKQGLDSYTRTELTYLGTTSDGPLGWQPSDVARSASNGDVKFVGSSSDGLASASNATDAEAGSAIFVGYGCASCHGLDATGTNAGPSVTGTSPRRLANMLEKGPKSMPVYGDSHLLGADLDLIAAFLGSLIEATPTPEPVARIKATPFPQPTTPPAPTQIPTPTAVPVATLAPGVPTPTPAPPTPIPEPTATPAPVDTARLDASQTLFFDVGCDICHGELAEGGSDGPTIENLTAEEIRDFVRDPQRPSDSKFSEGMDPYELGDLTEEELDEIIFFLLNRSF